MTTQKTRLTPPVQAGGQLNVFERYLTLWVGLCIGVGILLGRIAPGIAVGLDNTFAKSFRFFGCLSRMYRA